MGSVSTKRVGKMKQRPFPVTVMSLVMIVIGLFQGLIGVVTFANRNDAEFLADSGQTSSALTAWGLALIVFGVVSVVLGVALLSGSRLARMLVGLFEVAQIVGAVWLIVEGSGSRTASAVGTIVGALILLHFLFRTEKAKAFFAS
jgi:hypothetical protein